jgi:hypothetical protein
MQGSLLIGSHALNHALGYRYRERPLDWDIIATREGAEVVNAKFQNEGKQLVERYEQSGNFQKEIFKYSDGTILEAEIFEKDDQSSSYWIYTGERAYLEPFKPASLNTLYMLKMSHRYLKNSPHFMKTMRDIQEMRRHNAYIESVETEVYEMRMKETYNYGHPKLNVSKTDFFTGDGVTYVYDHDDIHIAVAFPNPPAYTLYATPGKEVHSSKDRFLNECSLQTRLRGVYEETCVLALERSQIPHRGKIGPQKSFQMALEKVCTSITSGWFREFAWEHFDQVRSMYNPQYVDNFFNHVNTGLIAPRKV